MFQRLGAFGRFLGNVGNDGANRVLCGLGLLAFHRKADYLTVSPAAIVPSVTRNGGDGRKLRCRHDCGRKVKRPHRAVFHH